MRGAILSTDRRHGALPFWWVLALAFLLLSAGVTDPEGVLDAAAQGRLDATLGQLRADHRVRAHLTLRPRCNSAS